MTDSFQNEYKFIVSENEEIRLDVYLSLKIPSFSRAKIQRLIRDGFVNLNAKNDLVKNLKVEKGDQICLKEPLPSPSGILAEKIPLDILFQDDDILIVNKPKGMPVHPSPGHSSGTLVNALLGMKKINLSGIGGKLRPGIVHRIDKNTSGILVICKNDFAHNFLAKQFFNHSITREYLAIVKGSIKNNEGEIESKISRHPKNRKKYISVPLESEKGKYAKTHFKKIGEKKIKNSQYSLLSLKLETGRTHQIRVHLSNIGYPIIGDEIYGVKKNNLGIKGQALHAKTLGFIHPKTKKEVFFESKPPSEFKIFFN